MRQTVLEWRDVEQADVRSLCDLRVLSVWEDI